MGNCSTPTHTVARQPGRRSARQKKIKRKKKTINSRTACGARKIASLPGEETALQREASGNALRPACGLFCQCRFGSAAGRSAARPCVPVRLLLYRVKTGTTDKRTSLQRQTERRQGGYAPHSRGIQANSQTKEKEIRGSSVQG